MEILVNMIRELLILLGLSIIATVILFGTIITIAYLTDKEMGIKLFNLLIKELRYGKDNQ